MTGDHSRLQQKLDASKARNKVLSNELKSVKAQIKTLMEKGSHDDELIAALMVRTSTIVIIDYYQLICKLSDLLSFLFSCLSFLLIPFPLFPPLLSFLFDSLSFFSFFFFFGISFHFSALSIKKEIHHVHTLSCSFFTLKMTYPQELETPDNTNSRSWYLSLKTTTQTTTTQFNNNIISLL